MVQTPTNQTSTTTPSIPPLENGDPLSQAEFERRYQAMPEGYRAELIEGIVYMTAALRFRSHGKPHSQLNCWLSTYQAFCELALPVQHIKHLYNLWQGNKASQVPR